MDRELGVGRCKLLYSLFPAPEASLCSFPSCPGVCPGSFLATPPPSFLGQAGLCVPADIPPTTFLWVSVDGSGLFPDFPQQVRAQGEARLRGRGFLCPPRGPSCCLQCVWGALLWGVWDWVSAGQEDQPQDSELRVFVGTCFWLSGTVLYRSGTDV